jgi:hypothetical protein
VVGTELGRAAALRDAMLAYMNDKSSPLNAYPAFWAPFSIIGEGAEFATPAVGLASQSEQPEQTCTAQMLSSQIPDAPRYVEARVMDTVLTAGVMTIAAIPPDMTVEVGDLIELNLRYRDHSLPCHFIPVTINRVIEHKAR